MTADEWQPRFVEALNDASAAEQRRVICQDIATELSAIGQRLWLGGYLLGSDRVDGKSPFAFGDDAAVGLATVSQIGGELVGGAVLLLEQGRMYAAAVLIRQLVEIEYLAWAFAEDREEAAAWLRSSAESRRAMWQPRHLRDRSGGRFRANDYSHHCECGGHPTPTAKRLLPDHSGQDHPASWWFDLAIHGSSVWRYVHAAIVDFGWTSMVAPRDLRQELTAWWRDDPLRPILLDARSATA